MRKPLSCPVVFQLARSLSLFPLYFCMTDEGQVAWTKHRSDAMSFSTAEFGREVISRLTDAPCEALLREFA